jgi:hypothetical protein
LSDAKPTDFVLIADVYPIFEFPHPSDLKRLRYKVVGTNTVRVSLTGDLNVLKKHAPAGNIDHMRLDFEADKEILSLYLFGGFMGIEATTFELSELTTRKSSRSDAAVEEHL